MIDEYRTAQRINYKRTHRLPFTFNQTRESFSETRIFYQMIVLFLVVVVVKEEDPI
jgi:hypothetical protein